MGDQECTASICMRFDFRDWLLRWKAPTIPYPPAFALRRRRRRYRQSDSQTRGRLASSSFVFLKGNSPRDIAIAPHLRFDTAFALEVIYYFSDELLDEYAKFVAERCDGPFVVTTLNESGPFLAARYLLRRLGIVERDGTVSTYTLREVAKASLGQIEKIPRCLRKGFDSRRAAKILNRYFHIEVLAGLPFGLPPIFDVYSGIVAMPRR